MVSLGLSRTRYGKFAGVKENVGSVATGASWGIWNPAQYGCVYLTAVDVIGPTIATTPSLIRY